MLAVGLLVGLMVADRGAVRTAGAVQVLVVLFVVQIGNLLPSVTACVILHGFTPRPLHSVTIAPKWAARNAAALNCGDKADEGRSPDSILFTSISAAERFHFRSGFVAGMLSHCHSVRRSRANRAISV
jgi:hypothetical protein